MHYPGKLFIISGPSRVGKDTIVRWLWRQKGLRPARVITYTTRVPRPGERQGITYHFIPEHEFKQLIERGDLLEWAVVRRARFGTPKAPVLENLKRGRNVFLQIDVQGATQVKAKLPETVLIFITAESPAEVQRRIFASPKMTPEQKASRWREAETELKAMRRYQYVVVNKFGQLAATLRQVRRIVQHELGER